MTDYRNAMEAAKEYLEGLEIKARKQQLSSEMLALKFERTGRTIRAIAKGDIPDYVPQEEIRLIQECVKERDEMLKAYKRKTMEAVCARYHVTGQTVRNYLEVEG